MSFPTFRIEDRELPIMLCGSSPFIGDGRFGFKATNCRIRFYKHPDAMADIFTHFIKQGCKGAHIFCYENILQAVDLAYQVEKFPIAATLSLKDVPGQLELLSKLETVLVFTHPSHTDSLDESVLQRITKEIRDAGMIPGCATYHPGVSIPLLEKMTIDCAAYLLPLNKDGKYMAPNKEKTLIAIKDTEKKLVAMKSLAVGNITPAAGFPFLVEHCDGFCVGFTNKNQIDDAYKVLGHLTSSQR
ncbi:MAG: hypothetical protein HXS46_17775 [Theionarchaea archaeon]|nr:MAG: hypothetical protein AYK18_10615 [Theionarchaea archaeon DG-70]MBU7012534.1 hypothetical protein [Theionarchaea archaeon]